MRTPKDTKLGELAKRLSAQNFSTQLLPASQARLDALQALYDKNQISGVNLLWNNGSIAFVRLYIGGKYRTLATCGVDYLRAARLADMVIYKLGPYRLRSLRPVPDSEFNFSRTQAAADWAEESTLAAMLLEIEAHLKDIGALVSESEPVRKQATLDQRVANLETVLASISTRIDKLLLASPRTSVDGASYTAPTIT